MYFQPRVFRNLPRTRPVHRRQPVKKHCMWQPKGPPPKASAVAAAFKRAEALGSENFVLEGVPRDLRSSLPVAQHEREFLWAVETHSVTIVVGETGCGKSTQLPQYLCRAGWASKPSEEFSGMGGGMVGVVVPRRVAAVTLAARVAEEMGVDVGGEVGYCVRFDSNKDEKRTKICFLTDGLLMRELLSDPLLLRYNVIILDDIHERAMATDIICGLLKKILRRRKALRVVISSATMDAELFAEYFDSGGKQTAAPRHGLPAAKATANADRRVSRWDRSEEPSEQNGETRQTADEDGDVLGSVGVLSVGGGERFPVDVQYLEQPCRDYLRKAVETVFEINKEEGDGGILVFLTSKVEVEAAVEAVKDWTAAAADMGDRDTRRLCPLPLYGALPFEQQQRVFQPVPRHMRKVIFTTNVAETAVTIEGIVFVVDCGFTKFPATDHFSGITYLTPSPVSKASAVQRAGRAGRMAAGKCFRLYTQDVFDRMLPQQAIPESFRSDLSSAVLYLKAMGVDNLLNFQFITPPPTAAFERALETLYALEALDGDAKLTRPVGFQMSQMPLPPQLARLLIVSAKKEMGCSAEAAIICAMCLTDTPWKAPSGRKTAQQLNIAKRGLGTADGDILLLYNIFQQFSFYQTEDEGWARRHMVNPLKLKTAEAVRQQLVAQMRALDLPIVSCEDDATPLLKAVCASLFLNACARNKDGATYRRCRGAEEGVDLVIHPHSILSGLNPSYVVFLDNCCTGQASMMRTVSVIDPRWLPEVAPHFFERQVADT